MNSFFEVLNKIASYLYGKSMFDKSDFQVCISYDFHKFNYVYNFALFITQDGNKFTRWSM
jgi:hypothetical protein